MISESQLLREFVKLYLSQDEIKGQPKIIIVLSEEGEKSPENFSRIEWGVELARNLDDTILVLNGTKGAQLVAMEELALEMGFLGELILLQDCGATGVVNIKTQFEAILNDSRISHKLQDCIIVTSTYHIPRVKRTAGKWLPPGISFSVTGNPQDWKIHNSFLKVMGEIPCIIQSATKGEILESPRN